MAGPQPDGEPVPSSGELPAAALAELPGPGLSLYLHVPFCSSRCGYCDFNTYTASELGDDSLAARYVGACLAEIDLAARVLGAEAGPVQTVFVGGGTPTLLAPDTLGRLLRAVEDRLGLVPGAEITTEANPESVTAESLEGLRAAGFTRISMGMQSINRHVLQVLDRRHDPQRALDAVAWARAAGFDFVNLDLIYGAPGESMADWEASLRAVTATGVDHVSAYALIVEDGTRLAADIRRGRIPAPDDDDLADKYLAADAALSAVGLQNYEISNWARPGSECRHNLAYWRGAPWWGIGAGAHSHVGGVRWWNVKHPRRYNERLEAGESPGQARELVGAEDRRIERVLLELRLRDGLPREVLTSSEAARIPGFVERGLLAGGPGNLRLTLQGRLLADGVVRDLLD